MGPPPQGGALVNNTSTSSPPSAPTKTSPANSKPPTTSSQQKSKKVDLDDKRRAANQFHTRFAHNFLHATFQFLPQYCKLIKEGLDNPKKTVGEKLQLVKDIALFPLAVIAYPVMIAGNTLGNLVDSTLISFNVDLAAPKQINRDYILAKADRIAK